MKRVLSWRLFPSFLALTFLLGATLTLVVRNHALLHFSTKSVTVSSSGQKLTTLFDGSERDPRYSSKAIRAIRRTLPACGKKAEKPGIMERLSNSAVVQHIFGSSVVYAGCLRTECGGTNWVTNNTTCNTGMGCSGTQHYVTTDPSSDLGEFQDPTHCGSFAACGCNHFTC
jgi:hypothetical protein